MCSLMRVAPPQKFRPQLLHFNEGDVACSVVMVTEPHMGPMRAGSFLGIERTRAAGLDVSVICSKPRRALNDALSEMYMLLVVYVLVMCWTD